MKSLNRILLTKIYFATSDIQMFLTSLLDKMYRRSDIWIGMKYDEVNQTYRWLDGSIIQYTNWINKEPDPRRGKYVKVGLAEGARNFLFWKSASQRETLPFFCQKVKGTKNVTACFKSVFMGSGTSRDLKQLKIFIFLFVIANQNTKPTPTAVGKKMLVRLLITTTINNYTQFF